MVRGGSVIQGQKMVASGQKKGVSASNKTMGSESSSGVVYRIAEISFTSDEGGVTLQLVEGRGGKNCWGIAMEKQALHPNEIRQHGGEGMCRAGWVGRHGDLKEWRTRRVGKGKNQGIPNQENIPKHKNSTDYKKRIEDLPPLSELGRRCTRKKRERSRVTHTDKATNRREILDG